MHARVPATTASVFLVPALLLALPAGAAAPRGPAAAPGRPVQASSGRTASTAPARTAAALPARAAVRLPVPAVAPSWPTGPRGPAGQDALADPSRPWIVAHRGASAAAPENTLEAVDKAAELGVTWVENDVQRTKDGRLVVIHDENLARTTNAEQIFPGRAPWRVKDFTAAEIARLDAGGWFSHRYAGARVPALESFLDRLSRHHQNLLLEIKSPALYPGIERQILRTLDRAGWLDGRHLGGRHLGGRLVVQSFSADSLRTVHRLRPGVRTGLLGTPSTAQLPAYARFVDQIDPSYGSLSAAWVTAAHRVRGPHGRPLGVWVWTVDDTDSVHGAVRMGVDGIITNRPDTVRRALEEPARARAGRPAAPRDGDADVVVGGRPYGGPYEKSRAERSGRRWPEAGAEGRVGGGRHPHRPAAAGRHRQRPGERGVPCHGRRA